MDNNTIKDTKTEYAVSNETLDNTDQLREWILSFYKVSNNNGNLTKTIPGVRPEIVDAFLASWQANEQVYRALKDR